MFHTMTNTSKLASWALVNWLKKHDAHFIDCQLTNPYLTSLGATEITRSDFLAKLILSNKFTMPSDMWKPQQLENIELTDLNDGRLNYFNTIQNNGENTLINLDYKG